MNNVRKFYVTTPIYYVNAKPHLGSLYSTVLADVAARWHNLQGKKTFLLTGTDEHGQKIAQAATAVGKEPKEFVDSFIQSFKEAWKAYEIDYNYFVRTTDPVHVHAVQTWIRTVQETGDIYKAIYQGYYCIHCESFVTEKDQTTLEQGVPLCPTCGRLTHFVEEESYFFKLSAYQDRLLAFYQQHPDFITPRERLQEVIAFVQSGLKDLSISRTTVTWGIPFPGDERHVCYVWADALNNYLSAIGYADPKRTAEFTQWWPADLQVLGKDIVRFHAVYWPAFLMAAGLEMPHRLLVHGWIKMGERKMSKSLGNVIDPMQLLQRYGPEPIRYYLVRHLAVTQDSPFTIEDLEQRINADLAHDLSNLLNRMVSLAHAQGLSQVFPQAWQSEEQALYKAAYETVQTMQAEMETGMFHRAYGIVWQFIHTVNRYFHDQEPWKYAKTDRVRFERCISATAHSLRTIGLLVWPVMPSKMETLLQMLGHPFQTGYDYRVVLQEAWNSVFTLHKQEPLFMKIEPQAAASGESSEQKPIANYIAIDDFAKVELTVGTITKVEELEKSDKLYLLTVDFGSLGIRQVCSGVRKYFTPEQLLHIQGIFVTNLQPRQMMGHTSQGMMLFAKDETGAYQLVTVGKPVPNGTRLG